MTRRFRPASAQMPDGHVVEQLETAFLHAPTGVALVAADGRFVRVNPALARLLGRSEGELHQLRRQDLMRDLPAVEAAAGGALCRASALDDEFRTRRADGAELWLRVTARPLGASEDNPARLVVHYEDVTARRAEQQRRLLAAMAGGVSDAVVVTGRGARILFLNAAAERLYGVRSHDVEGRPVADALVHTEARNDAPPWQLGQAIVARHRRADGTAFEAEVSLSPVYEAGGAVLGMAGVVREVTEHDLIRFISPSAERIRGWPAGELIGVDPEQAVEGMDADLFTFAFAEGSAAENRHVIETGRSATIIRDMPLLHGGALPYVVTKRPISGPEGETGGVGDIAELRRDMLAGRLLRLRRGEQCADGSASSKENSEASLTVSGGALTGTVAIIRVVSELIENEQQLRERAARLERSNVDLESFAYAASHDLQEPLRSIKMSAETVMRAAGERLDDDERGLLEHVERAAMRMSAQIDALMQVARVALATGPDEPVPVRLALEDALNALHAAICESNAEVELQEPLPVTAVPRAEMALVLQNLLANAIRYRREEEKPRITVSGGVRDGCVEVRIADNGAGLSETDRAHIFAVFGRAQQGVPGTGMGLAVCRRLLERRGGSISASSEGPGRGSVFVLRVPAAEA